MNSEGFLQCQRLAQESVVEIAKLIQEGWTEQQASQLIETYLRDNGVKTFFHKPYAWFGERSRFDGISNYAAFMPSGRVLRPNEPFILDVAPILDGFIADIGYSDCLGAPTTFQDAVAFLKQLRSEIPSLFSQSKSGGEACQAIEAKIKNQGYENRHQRYPFAVIGHRVHQVSNTFLEINFLNFGWQSFWSLLSRGLFSQLLNRHHRGDLTGLWAIEPHLGGKGFGAKFEEILVVEKDRAYWLEETGCFCQNRL